MAQANTAGRPASKAAQPKFEDQPFAVKLLVLVVLLGFIGAGYYFALHMSLADEISGAEAQHTSLIQERAQAEQRQQEYLRVSQELAEREPIDRLNKRILPENAEIPAFLEDVNRVAELAGLQIRRVEPTEEVPGDKYVRIPIAMEMEGRFHQFAKFFYNIGQLERAASMHIESIRYAASPSGGASQQQTPTASGALPEVRLVVELEATAFRRPLPEAAATTAAAPGAAPTGGR